MLDTETDQTKRLSQRLQQKREEVIDTMRNLSRKTYALLALFLVLSAGLAVTTSMAFVARRRDRPEYVIAKDWYDRNASDESLFWGASDVPPHSMQVRAEYTVPAGRRAFVGGICIEIRRQTAATSLGVAKLWTAWAGNTFAMVAHADNTANHIERLAFHIGGTLQAGQNILIGTYDTSTGGTLEYVIGIIITEFDA